MNSDFVDLLSQLARHRVRYLIVGGYAVVHHAEPRYTKELDIFVEASTRNAARLAGALRAFAGALRELTVELLADPDKVVMMGRPPTRIDFIKRIDGVRFETAWKNRVRIQLDGVGANVISRRDLIRNKRASGRPQDLLYIAALTHKPRAQ